jgi:hypothetical protein
MGEADRRRRGDVVERQVTTGDQCRSRQARVREQRTLAILGRSENVAGRGGFWCPQNKAEDFRLRLREAKPLFRLRHHLAVIDFGCVGNRDGATRGLKIEPALVNRLRHWTRECAICVRLLACENPPAHSDIASAGVDAVGLEYR